MKTNKITILFLSLLTLFLNVSCDDPEEDIFLTNGDGTLISFRGETAVELQIPAEDLTFTIPVSASTLSSESRSFSASIVSATEGTANEYTIGSVTIPAGEYEGSLTIDFDFSEIGGEDGDVKNLVVALDPDGALAYNGQLNINYFREIVCNELELTVISDRWATESYVIIENADTNEVVIPRSFLFSANGTADPSTAQTFNQTFFLPDGNYIFKMGDAFGDGQVSTNYNGSYSLTCSIITHAEGEGAFSTSVPDPFTGAPNATVEVTNFSINP